MTTSRKTILICLLAATPLLAACGPDRSREDAHDVLVSCQQAGSTPSPGCVDKAPPQVIAFNNHYPNVETKCDGHGHRIFATTDEHGNGVMIYPDPTCPGFIDGREPGVVIATGGR